MDNIDILIENVMQTDIYIPKEFEQIICTALVNRENINYKNIIMKIITIITTLITITTGVVFGKEISKWINNIFNPETTNKSIIKMAENGYIQETNMEYVMNNDIGVKIDDILMDDYNLTVVFEFKTKEKILDSYYTEIADLLISDEKNNIIFCNYNRADLYEKFCEEHNLEYSKMNMHNNYTNSGYQSQIIGKTNNSIKILYKMYSNNYPRSKKLIFSFKELNIAPSFENIVNNGFFQKIKGNWNIEVELPPAFYNREVYLYEVKDNSDKLNNLIFEEAIGSYTELHIKLLIKDFIDSYESDKENFQNLITRAFDNKYEATLENENGKILEKAIIDRDNVGGTIYYPNGDAICSIVFQVSKEDYTNELKLNLTVKGKQFVINLSRK